MERYCSTGQSPERAVAPMEEGHWIFHLLKPPVPSRALRSTQPLTDVLGVCPGDKGRPLGRVELFTTFVRLLENLKASTS
jgi:hypothetical protein